MNSRQRRKLEAEKHNIRHMKQMEWEKMRPLFVYLSRLCETRRQAETRHNKRLLMAATIGWANPWRYMPPVGTVGHIDQSSKV